MTYPARHKRVIAIHSSDGLGNPSLYNPSPIEDDCNFSTLGQMVEGAWPRRLESSDGFVRRSGSSFAVCVAAGLFALVLEYAREKLKLEPELWQTLHSFEGAQAVLKLMSANRGGYRYMAPWLLWTDDESEEEVRVKIVSVLRNL